MEQVFGVLPSAESVNTTALRAPNGDQQDLKIDGLAGEDQGKLTLGENKNGTGVGTLGAVDGPDVTPKKHRPRVELDVFKINTLAPDNESDNGVAEAGKDGGTTTTAKHSLGIGKTPVRDLVKRVLGGVDNDGGESDKGAAPESE